MNKFERVYLDIKHKIENGTYPIGELIPTEHELAEIYDVSRETIRKAQKLLLENGFIHKKQGRGSTVLDFNRFAFPISGLVSFKELQADQNMKAETRVIRNEIVKAPDFLIGKEGVTENERFIYLLRTRIIAGEVMIIDEDWFRCSVVPSIPSRVAKNSVYEYLEGQLDLDISYATKDMRAEIVSELGLELMKLTPMDYVIKTDSFGYLEDTTFFQYSISHTRLEKFHFQEFARRRHSIK